MSLTLVWDDNAPTYPDCNLTEVVDNVIKAELDTFRIAQSDLLDAFRLAVASNRIEHTAISLQVQQTNHLFNQFGNFNPHGPWPVPSAGNRIIEELLMSQARKKRALSGERSVD